MTPEDWPAVEAIYAEGIATRQATFETATPTWAEFDAGRLSAHRFVAVDGQKVVGWVAISPTSSRDCYSGVVEHSVYVASEARGAGVGTRAHGGAARKHGQRWYLDDADEHLSGERGQPRPA